MATTEAKLSRLRAWIVVLAIIIVFAAFAAPLVVIQAQQKAAEGTQLAVTCTSARANISQLAALRAFSRQIGVPWRYPIPEVPAECDGH